MFVTHIDLINPRQRSGGYVHAYNARICLCMLINGLNYSCLARHSNGQHKTGQIASVLAQGASPAHSIYIMAQRFGRLHVRPKFFGCTTDSLCGHTPSFAVWHPHP